MGLFGSGRERPGGARVANPNDVQTSRQRKSLQAAGERVQRDNADEMRRLIQPWQSRSLTYYDIIPEIKYAGQFYSRALSKVRLFAAKLDENGEPQEEGVPDDIKELVERIKDPGGGSRSNLQASYGRLKFLTGECYVFVSVDPETEIEQWEALSADELRVTVGGEYSRFKAPSLASESFVDPPDDSYELLPNEAIVYRMWTRHPRYSALADSTMQGVLDTCEELVLLTKAVRARAKSRLAGAGILLVNGNVIPVEVDPEANDEDPDEDSFLRVFTEAMIAPISDEGAASAVVPIVVRIDTEKIDEAVKHIQIVDPTQLYPETGLRREARERLAIGLDMPPEALLGLTDSNHWTSWQIDEQTWKAHLQPVTQQMVDDFTAAYFQPTLRRNGVKDWQDYVIGFDPAAVINHPDRTKDAKDLWDREAISDQALRDACGFEDADEIPYGSEEWNRRVGIKLRDPSFVKYGEPNVAHGGILTGPTDLLAPTGEVVDSSPGGGKSAPADVVKEPPAEPPAKPEAVAASGLAGLNGFTNVAKILGASDLALHRARELAGSKIRSKARRDVDARLMLDGVRNIDVASTLGAEKVQAMMKQTPEQLVSGGTEALTDSFRMWGINREAAETLGALIERHAATTLFERTPSPMPESYMQVVLGLHAAEKV